MNIEFIILIIVGIGAFIGGIYFDYKKKIEAERNARLFQTKKLEEQIKQNQRFCDEKVAAIEEENRNILAILKKKEKLFLEINNINDNSIKKITSLFSDYTLLQYNYSAKVLSLKKRPAYAEAKRIKDLKKETKIYIEQYKQMVYKYEYLLNIFPELEDYIDDFESVKELDEFKNIENLTEEFDYVRKYISRQEYNKLNEDERNQLALDNYVNGKKTKWQIGRDYELFCGQELEKEGWNVTFFGMEKKLNDFGRDLIAKKENEILVIQCKYWGKEKLIHEKHILQLFATKHIMELSNFDLFHKFKAVFITNINLSETALEFAKILNIEVRYWQMNTFPRIKCNVNGDNKIYHLPFDQKYDVTQIKNRDEFYAFTVDEAVAKGFRRAFKYFG